MYVKERPRATKYSGATKLFVEFGDSLYEVAYGKPLEYLVLIAIVAASVVLSLQTYDEFETNKTLELVDEAVFYIFIMECIAKILSESIRPWKYFTGPSVVLNNYTNR